jgi:D-alanine-D-alanine ligase
MTFKKCCLLYNQPRENALPDELDVLVQADFIEKNLNELGIETFRKGITTNFMNEMENLADMKPDFVFNLVESINNKGELCYFIPALLNMYSIPYTGNPVEAMFITTSKALTSKTLKSAGISLYREIVILLNQYGKMDLWESPVTLFLLLPGNMRQNLKHSGIHTG